MLDQTVFLEPPNASSWHGRLLLKEKTYSLKYSGDIFRGLWSARFLSCECWLDWHQIWKTAWYVGSGACMSWMHNMICRSFLSGKIALQNRFCFPPTDVTRLERSFRITRISSSVKCSYDNLWDDIFLLHLPIKGREGSDRVLPPPTSSHPPVAGSADSRGKRPGWRRRRCRLRLG